MAKPIRAAPIRSRTGLRRRAMSGWHGGEREREATKAGAQAAEY